MHQHLGLEHPVQRLEVEELFPQVSVVGLHERILATGTWFDVAGAGCPALAPAPKGLRDELRAVVAGDVEGVPSPLGDLFQDLDGVLGGGVCTLTCPI